MSLRQQLLKKFYPALLWLTGAANKNNRFIEHSPQNPPLSFYELTATTINAQPFAFSTLKGKKVLLVNTASDCGYTAQYAELQQLYAQFGEKLTIIGVPSNEFKEQEKGTATDIENFCKRNYGVTFILLEKSIVKNGAEQHPVYQWLTDPQKNGWNTQEPVWNFSKYLVDEQGRLTHYMDPSVSPLDTRVVNAITN
ncbi:MAG: glutathione peroxidase [Chitinophagaceae bacterium]